MHASPLVAVALGSMLVSPALLDAQVSGCPPAWQSANSLPGAQHVSATVTWDPDGSGPLAEHIVIAGRAGLTIPGFEGVAGTIQHWGVAMFDPSNGEWSTLGTSAPWTNLQPLVSFTVDSNNQLYINTVSAIYRWQSGVWINIGQTNNNSTGISQVTAGANGELFLAGGFDQIGGVAATNIARYDGSNWHALGLGVDNFCAGTLVRPNGDVFAYGWFDQAGNVAADGVAIWNGGNWAAVGSQAFSNPTQAVELLNGDLVLYQTGSLHRWNGTAWTVFVTGANGLFDMIVRANGDLVVGGNFLTIAGVSVRHIASWNGTTWSGLGSGVDRAPVTALANMGNGHLVAAGAMTTAGGKAASSIARWDDTDWQPLGTGFNGEIRVLKRLANGDVLAAGAFTGLATANGTPANRIARFDGSSWHAYGAGFDNAVRDVAELPNGDLVAVGHFLNSGTTATAKIAYWNGSNWSALGSGSGGNLHAVVVLPNGNIVAAGFTLMIGGLPTNNIGSWNGTSWSTFGTGSNLGVEALAVMPNGDLIAGGAFSQMDGMPANGIARWDGSSWQGMAGGTSYTFALYVNPDGVLFAAATGTLWQWTGSSWLALGGNGSIANSIEAFAMLPNGQLVTGSGEAPFLHPNLQFPTESNLDRYSVGVASSQSPLLNLAAGRVRAMLWQTDGSLLVAGDFLGVYGAASFGSFQASPYLARIEPTCEATADVLGSGCTGSAGAAVLSTDSAPWLGSTFTATATGMPGNSIAIDIRGTSTTAVALPLATQPGCILWTSQPILDLLVPNSGVATSSMAIPSTQSLVGFTFRHQVAAIGFNGVGGIVEVISTNALELTLGAF